MPVEDDGAREPGAVAAAPGRDALGQTCFLLHLAIMIYFVVGWLAPWHAALVFYLFFVPAVALQWQCNKNACVLNNLETWLRSGQWRDPGSREEGAWLASLAEDYLRFRPGPLAVEIFTYGVLLAFWTTALIHLLYWTF
jgi:hypothetical protein